MKDDIGSKIRKVREVKGLSQDFMATQLEISQRQMDLYYKAISYPAKSNDVF